MFPVLPVMLSISTANGAHLLTTPYLNSSFFSVSISISMLFLFLYQGFRIPDTLPELHAAAAAAAHDGPKIVNNGISEGCPSEKNALSVSGPCVGGKQGIDGKIPPASAAGAGTGAAVAAKGLGLKGEGAVEEGPPPRTAILHHPLCLEHHSCPPINRSSRHDPPPENVKRLEVIYNEVGGSMGRSVGSLIFLFWPIRFLFVWLFFLGRVTYYPTFIFILLLNKNVAGVTHEQKQNHNQDIFFV